MRGTKGKSVEGKGRGGDGRSGGWGRVGGQCASSKCKVFRQEMTTKIDVWSAGVLALN